MHRISIPTVLQERVRLQNDGRLYGIGKIDAARAAHLIVDMQNGFMAPGAPVEVTIARQIVPNINAISRAMRAAGGRNIFLQYTASAASSRDWSHFYKRLGAQVAQAHRAAFEEGSHYWQLWKELEVDPHDHRIPKARFSAMVPGTCALPELLEAQSVDTLIISGTLTNVCCESTARDAMQRNYQVVLASDATAALSDEEHSASLTNVMAAFGDVMSTQDIIAMLEQS